MAKQVLYALLCFIIVGCSEKLEFESDLQDVENIKQEINNPLDVSQKDAISVASEFFRQETKSSNKEIGEVVVVKDSVDNPLAYVINYAEGNGFVVVSATKEFYPILAFSEIGSYKLETGMFSDMWLALMKSEIVYRKSDNDTTYFSEWNKYLSLPQLSLKNQSTKTVESYQNIGWWRSEFIADLWNIDNYPPDYFSGYGEFVGDMFCSLSEVRAQLDDYNGDFDRVESSLINMGYDPDVAIFHVKTFRDEARKDIMLSTYWHQDHPFNLMCPNQYPPGCVPVAIGQIMNYHKWPANYANWTSHDLNNTNAAFLLSKIGFDIDMVYGKEQSFPRFWMPFILGDLTHVKNFFKNNQYSVSKDASYGNLREISSALMEGYPCYMEGSKESFSFLGISFPSTDAHAWVCDGYIMYKYTNVLVDLYLPQNYNQGDNTPLEKNPYRRDFNFLISKEREYGWSYYHMNWGWGNDSPPNIDDGSTSVNNGWYLNADISAVEDVSCSVLYRYIKVVPNR